MADARDTAETQPLGAHPDTGQITAGPLLTMRGIVKRYGATVALNGVDLEVYAGEIHALLGENGAGKSTLMHILSGLTRPDAGEIYKQGQRLRLTSPREARAAGIAMVHQHFTLVPAFTVAENLALDAPTSGFRASYRAPQAAARALERAAALGWNLEPDAPVADLSVGAQQRVEIVKALATGAPVLIFDEPTAVLAAEEVTELFTVLRRLRNEGRAILLITHKLAEILAVADRVTVLRRGTRVASCPVAATNLDQLALWMVGTPPKLSATGETTGFLAYQTPPETSEATPLPDPTPNAGAKHLNAQRQARSAERRDEGRVSAFFASGLIVRGDRGDQAVRSLILEVGRGEIFGIGGVDGNGQTELAEALVGLRRLQSGSLMWEGQRFVPGASPSIGYIPQDRRRAGLAVTMTVEENLLFEAVREPPFRRGPLLRRKALQRLAGDLIRQFDIRTSSPLLPVAALSGGNQQKIVVARALRSRPDWIVAVNPTRGLDIGATRFVHAQLRQAKARGVAIVLITTDLDELKALADRAAILSGGTLQTYQIESADATQLGLLLGGVGTAEASDAPPPGSHLNAAPARPSPPEQTP